MKDIKFSVEYVRFLTDSVFELKLNAFEDLGEMLAGQFLHLKVNDDSLLLRRPFCLSQFDARSVTLIIAVVGKGTKRLATLKRGETVSAVVPLGNGFKLDGSHKKIALIGGGVGAAPLLMLPKLYPDKEFKAFLGFSNARNIILKDEFSGACETVISTDDGSLGYKGYISDAFKDGLKDFTPDVILVCGPHNLIKAVAGISAEYKIPAYMSGEDRMACGVGACLVCACAVKSADGTVKNLRACADGPVFKLEELVL